MKKFFTSYQLFLLAFLLNTGNLFSQNAILVNFGSNNCYSAGSPAFSLINNPLSTSPSVLAGCGLTAQLPDFFSVFIAYNPLNNKIYVADVRSGIDTKIWVMDMGLPSNIVCPAIPVAPTYSYSYVSNNFEFDNNGDLWSFSNYNVSTGQCNMDKFDVATGNVINTRVLQFPVGNFPTSISSGDLTILPNGRMFATLGSTPSRLYEINNYNSTSSIATATYLQTMPSDCYGIAYLNGQLEITGIDFSGICYYFDYNISTNTLGVQKSFQIGQGPIDNTSLTPSLGVTKHLVNTVKVNSNTADLTYEVYVKNIGNVIINDINVADDLGAVFGPANVSNVSTAFVAGANMGALTMNPFYNGTTNISILNAGQKLPNQTLGNSDYYFTFFLKCRVTNLNAATIYLNSAIARGTIGNAGNSSLTNIADSSNNGTAAVVDPNNNGNAGEVGENIPTPFVLGILPVNFINVSAALLNTNTAVVKWKIATPAINAKNFEVEFSTDGIEWTTLSTISILSTARSDYQINHQNLPTGNLYYRIRQTDNDGVFVYSRIVLLEQKSNQKNFIVLPNPANQQIQVSAPVDINGKVFIELFDAAGRKIYSKSVTKPTTELNTTHLATGTYLLKIIHNEVVNTRKVMIVH